MYYQNRSYGFILLKGHYDSLFPIFPFWDIQFNIFSGYVDDIKLLLLSLENVEFEKVRKKHEKAVPKPLNTQFDERLSKPEAIKKHMEKKNAEKTTAVFPTSKIHLFEWLYNQTLASSGTTVINHFLSPYFQLKVKPY